MHAPRVAVCQIELTVGDPSANRRKAEVSILRAAEAGADVVVLPELVNSGYVFDSPEKARALAEDMEGETVAGWRRLAYQHALVVVGGICEIDGSGILRDSAVMVDPTGIRSVYRKAHLWGSEKRFFTPGDESPPVVDTQAGRLSMMVCYDVEFPEWVRLAALGDANLICVPANWPALSPAPGPYTAEVLRVLAMANMNAVYIAVADRVGPERGVEWIGGSCIAGPGGERLTEPISSPGVLTADIRPFEAGGESGQSHPLRDRRPNLYAGILHSGITVTP